MINIYFFRINIKTKKFNSRFKEKINFRALWEMHLLTFEFENYWGDLDETLYMLLKFNYNISENLILAFYQVSNFRVLKGNSYNSFSQ